MEKKISVLYICYTRPKVFLHFLIRHILTYLVGLWFGSHKLIWDMFIFVKVSEQIAEEGVLLVQFVVVPLSHCLFCCSSFFEFKEDVPAQTQGSLSYQYISKFVACIVYHTADIKKLETLLSPSVMRRTYI